MRLASGCRVRAPDTERTTEVHGPRVCQGKSCKNLSPKLWALQQTLIKLCIGTWTLVGIISSPLPKPSNSQILEPLALKPLHHEALKSYTLKL